MKVASAAEHGMPSALTQLMTRAGMVSPETESPVPLAQSAPILPSPPADSFKPMNASLTRASGEGMTASTATGGSVMVQSGVKSLHFQGDLYGELVGVSMPVFAKLTVT